MIDYDIIASGSSGNCFRLNNILIDLGITKKKLLENIDLKDISSVLITHSHSDHVNKASLKELRTKNIYCSQHVYDTYQDVFEKNDFKNVTIIKGNDEFFLDDEHFLKVIRVIHDVVCYGFVIEIYNDDEIIKVLYATDLERTLDLPKDKYDAIFLESNYDEYKWAAAYKRAKYKQKPRLEANKRHLSKQEHRRFVMFNTKEGAIVEEMHKSSTYY